MSGPRDILRRLCRCPDCRGPLEWSAHAAACPACGADYPVRGGAVFFREPDPGQAAVAGSREALAESWPAKWARRVITSEYRAVNHLQRFLATLPEGAVIVESGAGRRRLTPDTVTVDLFPFDTVDLVADAARLPLGEGCADAVVLDTMLEHVPDPQACVDEARRVLAPGGRVLCTAPLLFHYHGHPRHYWNFTEDGLAHLFRAFREVTIVPDTGPSSAVSNVLAEYAGLALPGAAGYGLGRAAALTVLLPFKFLDRLWRRSPKAKRIAATLCLEATR
jgi:SAM-dependent methyltransferase